MDALRRGRVLAHAYAGAALDRRADRPRREAAAAVRADVVQHRLDAMGAEGAFVAADAGLRRVRRQVLVAALAVGAELQHGAILTRQGGAVMRGGASDQAAGAGDQLALQAAAGADLEHRLVGLADGEFQRGGVALALERVGQRLEPVGRWLSACRGSRRVPAVKRARLAVHHWPILPGSGQGRFSSSSSATFSSAGSSFGPDWKSAGGRRSRSR